MTKSLRADVSMYRWKPGQSGNPGGRPATIPKALRNERKKNLVGLIKLVALYCNLTEEQARARQAAPNCLQLENMVQGVINKASEGDYKALEFILSILVGKIPLDNEDEESPYSEEEVRILKLAKNILAKDREASPDGSGPTQEES